MNRAVRLAMWAYVGGCVVTTGAEPVSVDKELVLIIPGPGKVQLRMKRIPAGKFAMGSSADEKSHFSGEGPLHQVVISRPFYMGVYEVTQAQWQAVMGTNPSYFGGKPQNPVEQVSWWDCQEFVKKLSGMGIGAFRLPTEAEWEYACRADTKTAYSFGDDASKLKEYANYEVTPKYGRKSTAPTGSFRPNPWGLYDMHGNVWEWCSDWQTDYSVAKQRDPKGAASGKCRVFRGGNWFWWYGDCRSARRSGHAPSGRGSILGFRLVRAAR
jgi:formylglycine-generating enzyme required for sulfatase activity